jgi:hypothetical protein
MGQEDHSETAFAKDSLDPKSTDSQRLAGDIIGNTTFRRLRSGSVVGGLTKLMHGSSRCHRLKGVANRMIVFYDGLSLSTQLKMLVRSD